MTKRILSLLLALALLCTASAALADEGKERPIRMLLGSLSFDMNSDYVAKRLEELTGYKVEYDYYADDSRLAMEISSGTEYDLIKVSANMFQLLKAQGAVRDIAPILAEFPAITDAIADNLWTCITTEDGGIYGIPHGSDGVYGSYLCYRMDTFAEKGYQEPNTIDEFYQLLTNIKADTGLIPWTSNSAWQNQIVSAFGLSYDYVIDPENDQIISALYQPGMKEYLAWMNKVYTEGLIDIDLPVNTYTTLQEKMGSGKAVICTGTHNDTLPWVNALRDAGDEDAYFKTILELEDENHERHIAVGSSMSDVFVFPTTAKDDDVRYVLGMIAARLEPSTFWAYYDGDEGVHYTLDDQGIPHPILPVFTECFANAWAFTIGNHKEIQPLAWVARVQKTQCQWDTFYDANKKASAFAMEGNPLAYANFDAYTEYRAALKTMCDDYFMQVIAGTESLDSYDAFVAEWEENGGRELLEQANEWYQANKELAQAASASMSPYAEIFGYKFGE